MTDLADFLLARIADDEAVAKAVVDEHEMWDWDSYMSSAGWYDGSAHNFAQRNNPVRVLAECEAKRRIVEREARRRTIKDTVVASSHSTLDPWVSVTTADGETTRMDSAEFEERFTEPADSEVLRDIALPYADHEDWREEWRT